MNEKLPDWNLETIYPDIRSKALDDDILRVGTLSDEIVSGLSSAPLVALVEKLNELYALRMNLNSYSEALVSTDTTNEAYMALLSRVEEAMLKGDEAEKRFSRELKNRKAEIESEALSQYRYVLEDLASDADHQMSMEEEVLASDLLRSGGDAFSRLQDSLTSTIEKDGETLIALRAKAMSADRNERKRAFLAEKALLKEHEVAFAFALNGVKGTVLSLEKRRGWASPISHSASVSRLSEEALNALIGALEKKLPMWHEYMNLKAEALGIEKMSFYDLFAPVGSAEKTYSFEEARKLVISAYSSFSPRMGAFAKKAFDNNWIDASIHKGKVGGAYDTCFFKSGESRVLCNFDHSYDAVSTLAHELGHAFHDSVVMELPALLADYPMPVAESASIFGETLLFNYCKEGLDKKELLPIIESTLSGGLQVCVDILSRFYFERDAFEERKKGDVSAASFCRMMRSAQDRTYGDAMDEKHEYMWAVKGHYYSTGFSFYNYPYAFGQLFALALYSSGIDEERYIEVLKNTGCMSADDVAAKAGFDIKKEEFWLSGLSVFERYLEMMRECVR